jgi:hypothetical protein
MKNMLQDIGYKVTKVRYGNKGQHFCTKVTTAHPVEGHVVALKRSFQSMCQHITCKLSSPLLFSVQQQ